MGGIQDLDQNGISVIVPAEMMLHEHLVAHRSENDATGHFLRRHMRVRNREAAAVPRRPRVNEMRDAVFRVAVSAFHFQRLAAPDQSLA